MILYGSTVQQAIDRFHRAVFVKELVVTSGAVPLAMVRKRLASNAGGTSAPVLLIHGFGQNRYAWHLPSRSLANALSFAGFDVFNLDLRGHGRSRSFGGRHATSVDDYVREDIPGAVEEVLRQSGKRPMFVVGHSLGGLVGYGSAPQVAGATLGLVTIGSPYHFTRGSPSLRMLSLFFEAARRAGLPTPGTPLPLYPVGLAMRTLRHVTDSAAYPMPLRGWHPGELEREVLDEHLKLAFDRAGIQELRTMFEWASSKRFGGATRDYVERFEAMDLPLLVMAGAHDALAPEASVRPAFERSRSRDKSYQAAPLGHIDLLVGRSAPRTTWATITAWMGQRH